MAKMSDKQLPINYAQDSSYNLINYTPQEMILGEGTTVEEETVSHRVATKTLMYKSCG